MRRGSMNTRSEHDEHRDTQGGGQVKRKIKTPCGGTNANGNKARQHSWLSGFCEWCGKPKKGIKR